MIEATRTLDSLFQWNGVKATETQSLKWPRSEVEVDGFYVPYDIIPEPVKAATCDMALFIFQNGSVSVQKDTVNSFKVGPISLSLGATAGNYPPVINNNLADYGTPRITKSGSAKSVKLVRV